MYKIKCETNSEETKINIKQKSHYKFTIYNFTIILKMSVCKFTIYIKCTVFNLQFVNFELYMYIELQDCIVLRYTRWLC